MRPPSLSRAKEDLEAGRPWLARDRLESYLAGGVVDQEVLELLGDVLFEMGDLPRAGRYLMLTARDDERVAATEAALRKRYPKPRELLAYLPVRVSLDAYPPAARRRLEELAAEARAQDGKEWTPKSNGWVAEPTSRRETAVITGVVLVTIAVVIAGVVQLVELGISLVRWLAGS
jgi:hypothetical protein